MSIRAMNWALGQRTDGPSAQSVLYVIADSANEHGITFHCNPDYIAERTRQSRGTVFRRMAELEEVGGLERFSHQKEDGRRLYEVRLNLEVCLNYKIERDGTITHLADDGTPLIPEDNGGSQNETQGGAESQIDTQTESPVIHPESHSCDPQDSIDLSVKNPKIPAPTPSKEGVLKNQPQQLSEAAEQRFREFKAAYPDGIVDLDKAQREFAGLADADQSACVTAAPVYAARCRKRREKSKKAHLFIRERAWVGLLAATIDQKSGAPVQYPAASIEGRALLTLARIARYSPLMIGGNVVFAGEVSKQALTLATAPPEIHWERCKRGSAQFAAWRDLAGTIWPGRGFAYDWIDVPWPWPPRKDGSINLGTTDPPKGLSDEDARALAGM